MRPYPMILSLLSVSLLSACGNNSHGNHHHATSSGGDGDRVQNESVAVDGSNIQGIYAATMVPVNNNQHLLKLGTTAIQRDGDLFAAKVRIKYGQRMTTLKQGIYTGTRCPTLKDDKNNDAYVDINEATAAIGKMIIPLDGNLDSQMDGISSNPTGDNILGSYFYSASGSFDRMFADLKTPDINDEDSLVKLKPEEGLALVGRVVVFQGINERVFLPPTLARDRNSYRDMPVACGILKKVKALPEDLNGTGTNTGTVGTGPRTRI